METLEFVENGIILIVAMQGIMFILDIWQFLDRLFNPAATAIELAMLQGFDFNRLADLIKELHAESQDKNWKNSRERALWIVDRVKKDILLEEKRKTNDKDR